MMDRPAEPPSGSPGSIAFSFVARKCAEAAERRGPQRYRRVPAPPVAAPDPRTPEERSADWFAELERAFLQPPDAVILPMSAADPRPRLVLVTDRPPVPLDKRGRPLRGRALAIALERAGEHH